MLKLCSGKCLIYRRPLYFVDVSHFILNEKNVGPEHFKAHPKHCRYEFNPFVQGGV